MDGESAGDKFVRGFCCDVSGDARLCEVMSSEREREFCPRRFEKRLIVGRFGICALKIHKKRAL